VSAIVKPLFSIQLFKRLWEGTVCTLPQPASHFEACSNCFNTGFEGGYENKGAVAVFGLDRKNWCEEDEEAEKLKTVRRSFVSVRFYIHWKCHVSPEDLLVEKNGAKWKVIIVEGSILLHESDNTGVCCWSVIARPVEFYDASYSFQIKGEGL
jgi:hypothetical protein